MASVQAAVKRLLPKSGEKPWLFELRSSKWFILSTVATAVFTDIFLYGVIVPVIPFALTTRAGVDGNDVQYWISILLAVYGAALIAASPVCGWFADRTRTRRAPLLAGLVVLAGATALLAVGSSLTLLIVGRAIQGLSAAVVWTVGLALLADTVGPDEVGHYMGYVSVALSLALLLAPLLGGVVFGSGGEARYQAVFAMCWFLIVLDIVMRLLVIEKKVAKQWLPDEQASPGRSSSRTDDPATKNLPPKEYTDEKPRELSLGASSVVGGGAEADQIQSAGAPRDTEPDPSSPAAPIEEKETDNSAQAVSSQGTDQVGSAKPPRKMPAMLRLLSSKRLLVACYASLVQASLLSAFDSTLPLRVRDIFHWDAVGAGLVFLPIALPAFLSPLIGWLSDRYGPRWIAAGGFVLCCPFLVLLRYVTYDSLDQKVLLCALLAFFGLTLTAGFTCVMAEVSYVVAAKERANPGVFGTQGAFAQAYGLFNMAFAGGVVVGPIWGGMVNGEAGWSTLGWSLAIFSASAAIPALLWTGGWIGNAGGIKLRGPDPRTTGGSDPV